jgi:hypothetical protein
LRHVDYLSSALGQKKRQVPLSEEHWQMLAPLFPETKAEQGGARAPVCLELVVHEGRFISSSRQGQMARQEHPPGSTCWRLLRLEWEQSVWLRAWQELLVRLDERRLLFGEEKPYWMLH